MGKAIKLLLKVLKIITINAWLSFEKIDRFFDVRYFANDIMISRRSWPVGGVHCRSKIRLKNIHRIVLHVKSRDVSWKSRRIQRTMLLFAGHPTQYELWYDLRGMAY